MSFGVVLLTTNMTISDRYDEVNKRIVGILFEAVHVFDESVPIRARHDRKVRIDQTQRQMIHVLCAETNKELLLIE